MTKVKNIALVVMVVFALVYCLTTAYSAGAFDSFIKPRIYRGVFVMQTGG